ncbi:hypothetical protein ACFL3P_05980 [Pseudomonadota bacterium]
MNLIKTTMVLLTLAVAILSAGCSIPVCCAPQPDAPLRHPETEKRIELIEHSLELFSNRKFEQLTALYADETRPHFAAAMKQKEQELSDEEIKAYVDGMRSYVFSKEGRVGRQHRWHVAYESELVAGRYIVYTVVKEAGEYRIVDLKVAAVRE